MAATTIRRLGVMSVGKIYGALTAGMGLLIGALFALASMVGMGLSDSAAPSFMTGLFGVGAIIILPLFYGVMGFIMGIIGAALYNLLAGVVGGVTIETE
jgi:hypothetical protein